MTTRARVDKPPDGFGDIDKNTEHSVNIMSRGFACNRCDALYDEHPGDCLACGHDGMKALTFSEYRERRRTGEEPGVEGETGWSLRRLLTLF